MLEVPALLFQLEELLSRVDFLSVGWWPVFNVADPSVVGGAILLVVLSLFGFDFDTAGRRRPDSATDVAGRRGAGGDGEQ